jgi:PAS domain S-box-containing protein
MAAEAGTVPELEREIEELRARVAELRRNRELLTAVANFTPSLLCLVDADGRVRDRATNIAFERTLGYDPSETGGHRFWERYVPPEDAADVRAALEEVMAGGEPRERDGRWLTSTSALVHVAWSCTPLPEIEGGKLYLICATDISERKRQAEELRRSRARIVAAGDEVRKRLERNLHDGPQQHLVAHLLSLRLLRARVEDSATAASLDVAVHELEQALDELRELARGIHPVALSEQGLPAALAQLGERLPVPVSVDVPRVRYAAPVEAAAYYLVSEALSNVINHAQATEVAVRVQEDGGRLRIEVADDGVGGADESRGSGLRGLRDRISALDGTFVVASPPGGGTRIRAEIPVG